MANRQSNYKTMGDLKKEDPSNKKIKEEGPPLLLEQLEQALRNYSIVVVDCWAPWCNPCCKMAPLYDQMAKSFSNNSNIIFLKDNINHADSHHKELVTSIPSFFIYYLLPDQQLKGGERSQHKVQQIDGGDLSQVQDLVNKIVRVQAQGQGQPQGHPQGHPQGRPQGHPQGRPQGHPQGQVQDNRPMPTLQ